MAVKLRLRRVGAKKQPAYRIVAADSRAPRDGRFIEIIGAYNPLTNPATININVDRAVHWLRNGAQPTDVVQKMLVKEGIWAYFTGQGPKPEPVQAAPAPKEEAAPAPALSVVEAPAEVPAEEAPVETVVPMEEEAPAAEEE